MTSQSSGIIFILIMIVLTASGIDIGRQGERILMQEVVETAIISTPLWETHNLVINLRFNVGKIKHQAMAQAANGIRKSKTSFDKLTFEILNQCVQDMEAASARYELLRQTVIIDQNRDKRALEILGDFLSSITGVPSARDYRIVLSKLNAVMQDRKGSDKLFAMQNAENRAILNKLHFHENRQEQISLDLQRANSTMSRNSNDIMRLTATLSIKSKCDALTKSANRELDVADNILQSSDSERLSRLAIPVPELKAIIDKIYGDRKQEIPLYQADSIEHYYHSKLSHSWLEISSGKMAMKTLLQIPIVKTGESQSLQIIPSHETLHSDLSLAAINKDSRSFRFLSPSDFNSCTNNMAGNICQKRKITITDLGCADVSVCKSWTKQLIHDLSNSKIIFILPNATSARLSCNGKADKDVIVPKQAVLTLSIHCELRAETFTISKLTFRHLLDQENNSDSKDEDFNLLTEATALNDRPKEFENFRNKTESDVRELLALNANFNSSLSTYIDMSDRRWESIDAGAYSWEQIALWAMTAGNSVLILILLFYSIRLHFLCRAIQAVSHFEHETDHEKRFSRLQSRLSQLEADHQLEVLDRTYPRTSTPVEFK